MRRRPVADDLGDVAGATAWVAEQVVRAGVAADTRFNIELCVEEALANLIEHGKAAHGAKDIAIAVAFDEAGATVVVTDRCLAFDATQAPSPAPPGASEVSPGGRGLRLMRAFTSELAYDAAEGGNVLTMRFRRTP